MLKTFEQKQQLIRETRLQNYCASLKLEGLNPPENPIVLSKAELLKKYKNISVV